MCGRFLLATPVAELGRWFGLVGLPDLSARYNIAPTQMIVAFHRKAGGAPPEQAIGLFEARWGLVPSWAKDDQGAARMINARAETVAEKPAFRSAFKARRCLVPADGWYEWQAIADGRKQPHLIRRRDRRPLLIAGLWESWSGGRDGPRREPPLVTATLITTSASPSLAPVHDRMPALVEPGQAAVWLDPGLPREAAQALLQPAPDGGLEALPVATRVNSPRWDDPACAEPLAVSGRLL